MKCIFSLRFGAAQKFNNLCGWDRKLTLNSNVTLKELLKENAKKGVFVRQQEDNSVPSYTYIL